MNIKPIYYKKNYLKKIKVYVNSEKYDIFCHMNYNNAEEADFISYYDDIYFFSFLCFFVDND